MVKRSASSLPSPDVLSGHPSSTATSTSTSAHSHQRPPKRRIINSQNGGSQNGYPQSSSSSDPHPRPTASGETSSDTVTSITLQPKAATALISQYVGSLRNDLSAHNAVYSCTAVEDGFACSLDLPFNSPVRRANSDGTFRSKQLAKQSAAFNAAALLMEAGEISLSSSDALVPTPANPTQKKPKGTENVTRASHPDETAREAAREQLPPKKVATSTGILGQEHYDFASPRWWYEVPPLGLTGLHPVVLTLSFDDDADDVTDAATGEEYSRKSFWKQCRALVILTSAPLPGAPYALDISQPNVRATARLTPFKPIGMTPGQLDVAFKFTRLFFRALLNKAIDGELANTAYFALPLRPTYARDGTGSAFDVDDIAWDEVNKAEGVVCDNAYTQPFDFADPNLWTLSRLHDAIISSPAELGRRFYVTRVRSDLSASSPDPSNEGLTFLDTAIIKEPWEYRSRKSNDLVYPDQALLEVEAVVAPKSGGVVATLVDPSRAVRGRKIVIPEFLEMHFLAASVFRTGSALVAAMGALDDELIAAELAPRFGGNVALVREAITCPASRAYPGGTNYERLEILGDTILKLATSVAVYFDMEDGRQDHGKDEGAMTFDRHKIVSNRALQSSIIRAGLVPYIRGTNRRARDFVPPLWTAGDGIVPTTQVLGDKTVADVAEALIGAAYLAAGRNMQAAMDSMRVLCIEINLERWPGLNRSRRPSIAAEPLTVMGYTFANPDLGRAAIHLDHDRHQFERLEFLGDAIIDLMTLEQLWDANPHLGPAPLTHMKHSRVANSALAAFLVCSDLYKQTEMDAQTTEKMAQYAAAVTAKRAEVDRHAAAGKRTHEFWNLIPSHKWMGDIVEAVFGAIFEDSGFDLAVVGAVYAAHLHPFVSRYAVPPHAHSLHPKSVLLELLALRKCHEWSIERTMVEEKVAAAVVIHGIVVGSAVEAKTALAVRNACEDALTTLKDVKTCPCAHKQVDT